MATITVTATQLAEALGRALDMPFGTTEIRFERGVPTIIRSTHTLKPEDTDKLVVEIQTT